MNLGDGLLFQLENGKPRLVLAKYGAESKSSNHQKSTCPILPKKKSQRIINSEHGLSQPERHKQDQKCRETTSSSYMAQHIADGNRKTINRGRSESHFRGTDRIQSERNGNDSSMAKNPNLVCLTQKQFQQILSTINSTNNLQTHTAKPVASSEENSPTVTTAEGLFLCGNNNRQGVEEEKKYTESLSHDQQSGLFSTFGERDAVEQRKTEWRRELDEQMALKRKQNGRMKSYDKLHEETLKAQANMVHDLGTAQTSARTENSNPKAQIRTHRQLPAAIRSAFIPGEAAPLENAFSTQRAEQQRQWLQELDQQREEAKLRRQREKEIDCQAEDIDRWAVHFDSLRQASAVVADHREPNIRSSLSQQRSISQALSTEGISVYGGENLGRANVETTLDNQQRTSHLRTMTALLDPAQIEEREHRRVIQVEHQEAVKAQVEERKRQREKEEATQRAREEEEEKRVERERQRLQEQFMKDTERQRNREELHIRKTEELYLSIQRAQEEALKDKHLQRIKDLARKGHDVSRLLRSVEGDSVPQVFSGQESPDTSASLISSEILINKVESTIAPSPRKDIAVQTVCDPDKQFSNADVTHTAPPNTLTARNSQLNNKTLAQRSHGTENINTAHTEAEADPYEPYARTSRNSKPQPRKKPEWNIQRPSKAFIPASERYPEALQQHRQKSRKHRQMELMMLVEKNTVSETTQQDLPPQPNNNRYIAQKHKNPAQKQIENQLQEPSTESRGRSPSVPAVKNLPKQSTHYMIEKYAEDTGCPPSLDYVPYVRSDEVYHMDPMASLSRPSTHETKQRLNIGSKSRQATPLVQQDPSHKSTERQQAILKGLSELRQGLLQKQREIESSFNPLLQTHKNLPPFRPV
ncbi:coiled-coil domain-containing protein 66 isoform X1 [Misgurnus anguillicaudatus]|uniref:coiled-coil domain-containing protein 66 isoform X1 n=1 Tax=Misgurnus anguillicaudatus TaxID=75329 RepID=UPI003CCFA583